MGFREFCKADDVQQYSGSILMPSMHGWRLSGSLEVWSGVEMEI